MMGLFVFIDQYEKRFNSEIELMGEPMEALRGFQKKFLKGRAHGLKPVVFLGQKGLTDNVIDSIHAALDTHELIKVKFNEFKEKKQKAGMAEKIEVASACQLVGMIGHIGIFYRQHADPDKRKVKLPLRKAPG
jgi:RNA-binding protein